MKLLFIVPRLDKASTRYRAIQYIPHLKNHGIESEAIPLPNGFLERLQLWSKCSQYDLVVLQKRLLSWWDLYCLKTVSKKLVYDFDDAIMFPDSGDLSDISKSRQMKFKKTIVNSDLVIAGNSYLQQCANEILNSLPKNSSKINLDHNDCVKVLSTPIDLLRYTLKKYQTNKSITIGWIGSKTTLPYLEEILPALEKLGAKYPNLILRIVSDEFVNSEIISVEKIRWSSENEISDLQGMDIGIMPLSDNAWTRGKCSFKLLQYMAVGTPVVCSPVGMNKDVVNNGVNGFWAENDIEWEEKLSNLVEDENLRETLGRAGRKSIEENYSLELNAKLMVKWFKE